MFWSFAFFKFETQESNASLKHREEKKAGLIPWAIYYLLITQSLVHLIIYDLKIH